MRRILFSIIALAFAASTAFAQETLSLDGIWDFRFDKGATLEQASPEFIPTDKMAVPGCFDVMPPYYRQRGTAMYSRTVEILSAIPDAMLRIDGVGLRGAFYVDGRLIGSSALPYSCVEFHTGALSAGLHRVTVAMDNNFDEQKMKLFLPYYDFYAFGGIYRGVSLTPVRQTVQLDRVYVRTRDINDGTVELELAAIDGKSVPAKTVAMVAFDGAAPVKTTFKGGRATLRVPNFRLWSPEEPNLHTVTVQWQGMSVKERFGIREIRTSGKDILLNGKKLYLKGVNRHESHPSFGSATPRTLMQLDIELIKSLGANFVRGSHYSQSQEFLDLCDEHGLLVWEESLGWGNTAAQMKDAEFIALAKEQTDIMVRRSFNHPSVIFFAFLNENKSNTAEGAALVDSLIDLIRSHDSGRLVTFACNQLTEKTGKDLGNRNVDVISFNTYPVWIQQQKEIPASEPEQMARIIRDNVNEVVDRFRSYYPDKPIIVSEMGACGIYGQRDESGAQWTEEFQAEYVGYTIDAAFANPEIKGFTIWHFADAPSYLRDGGTIRTKPLALNLAGLYDQYRRPKLVVKTVREKFSNK